MTHVAGAFLSIDNIYICLCFFWAPGLLPRRRLQHAQLCFRSARAKRLRQFPGPAHATKHSIIAFLASQRVFATSSLPCHEVSALCATAQPSYDAQKNKHSILLFSSLGRSARSVPFLFCRAHFPQERTKLTGFLQGAPVAQPRRCLRAAQNLAEEQDRVRKAKLIQVQGLKKRMAATTDAPAPDHRNQASVHMSLCNQYLRYA